MSYIDVGIWHELYRNFRGTGSFFTEKTQEQEKKSHVPERPQFWLMAVSASTIIGTGPFALHAHESRALILFINQASCALILIINQASCERLRDAERGQWLNGGAVRAVPTRPPRPCLRPRATCYPTNRSKSTRKSLDFHLQLKNRIILVLQLLKKFIFQPWTVF